MTDIVWFTIVASNQIGRFDPKTEQMTVMRLPHNGFVRWVTDMLFPTLMRIGRINGRRPKDNSFYIYLGGLIGGGWGAKYDSDGQNATIAMNETSIAMTLRNSVTTNSIRPSANAASVFALSNSWSPTSSVTICTVTVVTASKGFAVRLAASPAAMTTIMVSPIAR